MEKFKIFNHKAHHCVKVLILAAFISFTACGDWLDVVPDGIATMDMAFNSRTQAYKYLSTCYSHMPKNGNQGLDPGLLASDEMTCVYTLQENQIDYSAYYIGQGMQNATNPLLDYWGSMYQALRDCNIFLENIGRVPDISAWERDQWIAEVKVLKAYYLFFLVQMYGPVPIVRDNIPVSADVTTVKVEREPVDDCFQYIVELLDEAAAGENLKSKVMDITSELGRITKPIALALKAKVLVVAASPLFNGNNDQATLHNRDGTPLFNKNYEPVKWEKAVVACREAIEACHEADIALYEFPNTGVNRLTDTIATQMSLREAFTLRWNSEVIWANTQSIAGSGWYSLQQSSSTALNPAFVPTYGLTPNLNIPLKIAHLFYTDHGVPLEEDKARNINDLYKMRTAQLAEKLYVQLGSVTVDLHFDREPRFYAWVGFDRGIWYGQGRNDDKGELWYVACKRSEKDGSIGLAPITGYFAKKYVAWTNVTFSPTSYSITPYPWPLMRLSELYLLYVEAINEAEGPAGANSNEMFHYIDLVRERAGLKGVKESWDMYANSPKYNNKEGMRDIIRRERMIELAFEGIRFWDIRRWKTAPEMYRTPIEGWSMQEVETENFYITKLLYSMNFGIRDYFWPIRNSDLINNPNLIQNIGW